MLESGGRILTAVVGVAVLVAALIYVAHGILTQPFSPSSATDTSIVEPPPSGDSNEGRSPGYPTDEGSGSPTDGEAGGPGPAPVPGPGPGPGPGPTDGGGSTAPGPYTETSVDVWDMAGPLAVDVTVPQVAGGDPKIAEIFNSAMRAALDARTAEFDSGRLTGSDGAVVHIGEKVISGALLVTAEDGQGAVELADTVVVNLDTGTVMTLDDLFPDIGAALQRLQGLSRELGPSTSAAKDFDGNKVTAEQATFSRWLATPDGMRIYFAEGSVAPSSYKLVRLNVPWDELGDVLDPGITEAVRS